MIVAFAGFGGAGKTTAIQYLQTRGLGTRVYLGQAVHDEIAHLGLEPGADAELRVRMELRAHGGASVFVDLRAPHIEQLIRQGECPLIDAIFKPEEYARILTCGQDKTVLIGIDASFATRSKRVQVRDNRSLSAEELLARDRKEQGDLGTRDVLRSANFTISNEGSLETLYQSIDKVWTQIKCN